MLDKTEMQALRAALVPAGVEVSPQGQQTLSQMLDSLAAQPEPAPVVYSNHECDSEGFPLCRCEPCREKSKIRNAQEVARMFGPIFTAREKEAGLLDLDKMESGANGENYENEDVGSSR